MEQLCRVFSETIARRTLYDAEFNLGFHKNLAISRIELWRISRQISLFHTMIDCYFIVRKSRTETLTSTYEKPENQEEAKDFVARYGKMPPSTVGSCVLTHIPSGIQVSGVDTATIHFRETVATSNLIERLIADGEPVMSCAGGLMVEHPYVKEHLERIDGTEDSVMGLSKDLVLRLLGELSEKIKTQNTS